MLRERRARGGSGRPVAAAQRRHVPLAPLFGLCCLVLIAVALLWQVFTRQRETMPPDLDTLVIEAILLQRDAHSRLAIVAGMVVLLGLLGIVAWRLAGWLASLARARHQDYLDRSFAAAIDHLNSSSVATRLGGIHALERVALMAQRERAALAGNAADAYMSAVTAVLAAFIRERAPWHNAYYQAPNTARPPADIQTALAALARLRAATAANRVATPALDLAETDLRSARLDGAYLERASLAGAHLEKALLAGARLSGADLYRVQLHGADLSRADLSRAILRSADLQRVLLVNADLREADLHGAILDGADLSGADLTGASGLTPDQLARAITDEQTRHEPRQR